MPTICFGTVVLCVYMLGHTKPADIVCVVKTVYHAINKKKKNFGFWFDAMRRVKSLAKKRAQNYAES